LTDDDLKKVRRETPRTLRWRGSGKNMLDQSAKEEVNKSVAKISGTDPKMRRSALGKSKKKQPQTMDLLKSAVRPTAKETSFAS